MDRERERESIETLRIDSPSLQSDIPLKHWDSICIRVRFRSLNITEFILNINK